MAQTDSTEPVSVAQPQRSFLRRTKLYLLEYTLYNGFILVLLSYIIYTVYALFWVISGQSLGYGHIEANTWFISGGLVFAPVAFLLHSRTRNDEVRNPARHKQGLRQALMYVQLIIAIVVGVTFLLLGMINLVRVVIGVTDIATTLTYALPSLINAGITTVVILDIFTTNSGRSLKLFRPIFFGICILVSLVLLVMTAVFARTVRYDIQTLEDLSAIGDVVDETSSEVDSLADLSLDDDLQQRALERGYAINTSSNYELNRYQSNNNYSYKLCAIFRAESGKPGAQGGSMINKRTAHKAGIYCFRQYKYDY